MMDYGLVRAERDLGHVTQPDLPSFRLVDHHVGNACQAVPGGFRPLDDHLEHLLLLEQVPHLDALQDGGSRTPDIAGLDALLLRLGEVNLDFRNRLVYGDIHLRLNHAVRTRQDPADFVCFLPEDVQVNAVNAHPELAVVDFAGSSNLLLRVGGHLRRQARVPLNNLRTSERTLLMLAPSSMVTQSSPALTSEEVSEVMARPTWPPTEETPRIPLSSSLALVITLFITSVPVLAAAAHSTRRVRSELRPQQEAPS